jgi:PAS domain-containing protein
MANADERYWLGAVFGSAAVYGDTVWRRWVQAGSILLAGLALRAVLDTAVPDLPPFVTLYPAVAITGLVAGTLAGTVVCVISMVAADYLWTNPRWAFGPLTMSDAVSLALYVAACAFILTITHVSRAARRRAQAYFDVAEVMLVVVGIDRRIKAINRHGAALLGAARPADLIGQDWFDHFVPAEEREVRLRSWTQAIETVSRAPYESGIVCARRAGMGCRRNSGARHRSCVASERGAAERYPAPGASRGFDYRTARRAPHPAQRQVRGNTGTPPDTPRRCSVLAALRRHPRGRHAVRTDRFSSHARLVSRRDG